MVEVHFRLRCHRYDLVQNHGFITVLTLSMTVVTIPCMPLLHASTVRKGFADKYNWASTLNKHVVLGIFSTQHIVSALNIEGCGRTYFYANKQLLRLVITSMYGARYADLPFLPSSIRPFHAAYRSWPFVWGVEGSKYSWGRA